MQCKKCKTVQECCVGILYCQQNLCSKTRSSRPRHIFFPFAIRSIQLHSKALCGLYCMAGEEAEWLDRPRRCKFPACWHVRRGDGESSVSSAKVQKYLKEVSFRSGKRHTLVHTRQSCVLQNLCRISSHGTSKWRKSMVSWYVWPPLHSYSFQCVE